jgi:hypothetical protein
MKATRGKPRTAALLRSFVWGLVIACSLVFLSGTATAAVTATELTTGGSSSNLAAYSTASITPAANTLILAWVTNSKASAPDTPTLAGNGLTWVQVETVTWRTIAAPAKRTTLFRAMGASPTSGGITISFGANQTGCAWSVIQFGNVDTSGTDGSGAVVQAVTGRADGAGAAGLTITLAALADAWNATAGGFSNAVNDVNSISAGTGYTAFTGAAYGFPATSLRAEWRATGSTTVNVTQSQISDIAGIAVEIRTNASFNYRRPITIANNMTPASCSSNLSSFPIVVSYTDATLRTVANGGHVQNSNGYDIIFRAEDSAVCTDSGNPSPCTLDHEVERYNASTGEIIAWVRIPTLAYNAATTIYMYYGNAAIGSPTQNPTGVWGTDYKGVWHLKESGNGTAGEYKDSTSNANNGQGGPGAYPTQTTSGKIGNGENYNGAVYISVPNTASLQPTTAITLSGWINLRTFGAGFEVDPILRKGDANNPGNDYQLFIADPSSTGNRRIGFALDTDDSDVFGSSVLSANTWYYIVGTWSSGNQKVVYFNGVQNGTEAFPGPIVPDTRALYLGGRTGGVDLIDGLLDEARISNVARDACWIATEYNNQNVPATYVTVGAEGSAAPTVAKLASLDATEYPGGRVLVSWRTGYEVDNLGFHVYREVGGERVRVTPGLVAGSALFVGATPLTAGRSYAWWDRSPVAGASYWLEEWELSGARRWYGPVTVQPGAAGAQVQGLAVPASGGTVQGSSPLLAGLGQPASPSPPQGVRRKLRQAVASDEARLAVQWGLASRPAVKLLVSEEGWYRVEQEELVRAGLDPGADPSRLQLFADGLQVPILVDVGQQGVFASGDGIEFYGEGLDTPSTAVRVYWLIEGAGAGLRVAEAGGGGRWSPGPASFPSEVERADRTLYFPALLNGDEGNFFGAVVTATPVVQSVRVPHVDQAVPGELVVRLQGLTLGAHRVGVELNGTRVGTVVWEGMAAGELAVPVGGHMILEGDNRVVLAAEGGEGDVSAVESIRVRYAHRWEADGEGLKFSLGGYQEVTINGFRSSLVRVVDITDPWAVQAPAVEVVEEGDGYRATVGVSEPGTRTVLAVGTGTVRHPVGALPNRPSAWHAAGAGADLVIIAQRALLPAVEPLRALRESQGLKVAVVDVESVFDEFAFGARSPQAIRDFLARARETWSSPPRYLLLVGDASYDPRGYLGYGYLDLVPTKLVDTTYLETASDDWFADFDGDGIGDIPVGRIPVQTAWEAATVVGKIVAYEGAAACSRALLVADANDEANDFEGLSATVKAVLPTSLAVAEVYRGTLGDAAARNELTSQLNLGQAVVNYIGHGSVSMWHSDLFTAEDARTLANDRLSVWLPMTCLNGFFHDPQQDSLAEALLEAPGGAVAVWASSGLTESAAQVGIDEALLRLLLPASDQGPTLGDATRAAKAATTDMDVRRTWILFGDPTTRLK